MIGRLRGKLIYKKPPDLMIDIQGVGYEVQVPMSSFYQLPEIDSEVTLLTHFVVREDAQLLYGFCSDTERELFRHLIKVNGVGPKLALTILSGIEVSDFVFCIQQEDSARLTKLPGVGKKTAERLVVEMQDKIKQIENVELSQDFELQSTDKPQKHTAKRDAMDALIALGYKPVQAKRALSQIESGDYSNEELIRRALQYLATGA